VQDDTLFTTVQFEAVNQTKLLYDIKLAEKTSTPRIT